MAADLEAVIKKDFMVKRSLMKGIIKNENYKSRWFILTINYLRYCDGTLQDGPGKPKGDIPISNMTVVEAVSAEALGRTFVFQIVYHSPSSDETLITLYIQAISEEQRTSWITEIKQACQDGGVCMDTMFHPGVLRSGKYTCCDAINKAATGCTKATSLPPSSLPTSVPPTSRQPPNPQLPQRPKAERPVPVPEPTSPSIPLPSPAPRQKPNVPNAPVARPRNNVKPKVTKVLALYNFEAVRADDLSLTKGEEYELISEEQNWLKVKNKMGKEGFAPSNYVQILTAGGECDNPQQLRQYEWYYADTSLTRAEEILKQDGSEGCFLVRDSRKPGMYSLSLFTKTVPGPKDGEGAVKHYHIKRISNGMYCITESRPFATLPELVVHHKQDAHGIAVKLKSPPCGNLRQSSLVSPAGLGHETKEILLSELTLMEDLGAGQFGKVVHGKYMGTIDVAIKMLKEGTMSEKSFLAEAKTMTMLKHKNLVQLYGVCSQVTPVYIVTEYMKYGALLGYLRRNKHKILDETSRLLDMATQICSAMVYLESKSFIHRDLAARNCLVGENSVVKVADFGLARFVTDDEYTISAGTKFPVRWSAPEVILQNTFSSKSDVWSYGVLLWEIFTGGDLPYSSIGQQQMVDIVCQRGKRLSQPPKCPEKVFSIMFSCWAQEPESRPTFAQLYSSLESASES